MPWQTQKRRQREQPENWLSALTLVKSVLVLRVVSWEPGRDAGQGFLDEGTALHAGCTSPFCD